MESKTVPILFRCIIIAALPVLLLVYFAFVKERPENTDGVLPSTPERIISFAPSATEILFELGLGDKVVGVTQFCNYPPQATQKEKVGAHTDPNYEALLRLKPDLMVILKEQRDLMPFLDKYRIRYITIGSDSVWEIIESARAIAEACGEGGRGDSLARNLREKLGAADILLDNNIIQIKNSPKSNSKSFGGHPAPAGRALPNSLCGRYFKIKIKKAFFKWNDYSGDTLPTSGESTFSNINTDKPKVLLCVSRDNIGSGAVSKIFAAGASSFYNQLIESAGGANVLNDVRQAYPAIGAEAVVRLAPDIIVDISLSYLSGGQETNCGDWNAFKSVPAVKAKNVYCLSGDYLTVPGPRFTLILEDLKNIFSDYAQTRN